MKRFLLAALLVATPAWAGVIGGTHDHMGPDMGPVVDHTYLPAPVPGYAQERIKPSGVAPVKVSRGAFRTDCKFSHMVHDDPIVFPGQPGKAHLHTFFGNTDTSAHSTSESIATSGSSTCRGGTANRSAYWVPAMIDTTTGAPLRPWDLGVYYKMPLGPGNDPAMIVPPPDGLRMLAGNAKASTPQSGAVVRWQCLSTKQPMTDPNTGVVYAATYTSSLHGPSIPNCPVGSLLNQEIFFPACWNGVDLDSLDHKSHMAYAGYNTGCPTTHPVLIPQITFNVHYVVTEGRAAWRLSSDMYPDDQPAGLSSHGDWMNGWAPEVKARWNQNCNVAGFDCHANLLGDGFTLY